MVCIISDCGFCGSVYKTYVVAILTMYEQDFFISTNGEL